MTDQGQTSLPLTTVLGELQDTEAGDHDHRRDRDTASAPRRAWRGPGALDTETIEVLRRLWAGGIASGPGHLTNVEAIKAEGRRRRNQRQPGTRNQT